MKNKFTILGCGSSLGSPWITNYRGDLKKNPKNIITRCCAHIQKDNLSVLIDTSPDIKNQFLKNKINSLDAIIYTHEHADHISGVERFARKFDIPVWLTHGTLRAAKKTFSTVSKINIIDSHQAFSIRDIDIQPYPVPHDAEEPAQFIFGNGSLKLGVLTDTGCSTP